MGAGGPLGHGQVGSQSRAGAAPQQRLRDQLYAVRVREGPLGGYIAVRAAQQPGVDSQGWIRDSAVTWSAHPGPPAETHRLAHVNVCKVKACMDCSFCAQRGLLCAGKACPVCMCGLQHAASQPVAY